ncbi:O-antigen ligase family protein [Psychroflexus salinarum]|uniref:O-antigen ligase family protein n=1 Tax=Psychroflexus salinarum TaxID=546024 RepID=A0ABW3GMD2_9FLAO
MEKEAESYRTPSIRKFRWPVYCSSSMETKRTKILQFLVFSLFLVAPFIMAYEDVEKARLISARILPTFISTFTGLYRWAALGFLTVLSIYYLGRIRNYRITTPVVFISTFYFMQFLYALVDGEDYVRFFLMTVFSLLIPPVIGLAIKNDKKIIKYFIFCIFFFLIISIFLNGHLVLIGQRFLGFLNNPNTYGISTVFWLIILLLANYFQVINKKLFTFILIGLFFTMLFTGSRNAIAGMSLILIIKYYNQLNKMLVGVFLLLSVFLVISQFIDLSFLTSRFENIFQAASDSGRLDIWERAYYAINQNFWWGNGMDANLQIANTGNMHNSYIRFVLNMGIIFTIFTLLMYLFSIISTYTKRSKVPLILTGFLLVFAVANIGEDFFVGLGSSVFIYLLFIYGFINYFITRQNDTSR